MRIQHFLAIGLACLASAACETFQVTVTSVFPEHVDAVGSCDLRPQGEFLPLRSTDAAGCLGNGSMSRSRSATFHVVAGQVYDWQLVRGDAGPDCWRIVVSQPQVTVTSKGNK